MEEILNEMDEPYMKKVEISEPVEAKYDGYTVCPLITSIGTVMLG